MEDPTRRLVFLGIEIDTCELSLSMPQTKIKDFRELLLTFVDRKRASVKQLQALCGKLNWASAVVRGGRTFLRRMLSLIPPFAKGAHKVLLSSDFFEDLTWWIQFMSVFNGKVNFLCKKTITGLQTDACDVGGAGYFSGDYFYTNWLLDLPAGGAY